MIRCLPGVFESVFAMTARLESPLQVQSSGSQAWFLTERPISVARRQIMAQESARPSGRPPKVGAAAASQFFGGNVLDVLPGILIVFTLPAVVEIFELLVVIFKRLLGMVPQKQARGSIGAGVQGIGEEEGAAG